MRKKKKRSRTKHKIGQHARTDSAEVGGLRNASPCLLSELPRSHPASGCFPQIKHVISIFTNFFIRHLLSTRPIIHPSVTCFALMGVDLVMSSDGIIKLCEVNNHPALGWGTMSDVPTSIYARLVEDTYCLSFCSIGNGMGQALSS